MPVTCNKYIYFVQDARPEELVALVSCLVWTEKSDAGLRLREDLEKQLAKLRNEARKVGKVSKDNRSASNKMDTFRKGQSQGHV